MPRLITLPSAPIEIIDEQLLDAKDARFLQTYKLTLQDGATGDVSYYETVKRKNAADILPITVRNTVLLILQYRTPVRSWVLECPAGQIEDGETPIETATKELLEETGYTTSPQNITQVGGAYPCSAGAMSELSYLFYATECEKSHQPPKLGIHERLVSYEIAVSDIKRAIQDVMDQGGLIDLRLEILLRASHIL